MTTDTERIRLSGPAALVAAVPHLVGFVPAESLVVLSLRGAERAWVHLTLRFDLPPPALVAELVADVAVRLVHDRADQAVLICYTEAKGERPGAELVERLGPRLAARGIVVRDAVLVRGGLWRSYLCDDPACCDGPQPVPPAPLQLAAANVYDGRSVLPDREALVASLRPVGGVARVSMVQARERQSLALLERIRTGEGWEALRAESVRLFEEALARVGDPGGALTDDETARLLVGLDSVSVRDEVISWVRRRDPRLQALLEHLMRRAIPPDDAPACATFAWVSYCAGQAAVAAIAVDRALASDPEHGLTLLIDEALRRQVHPRELRRAAVAAGRVMRRR